MFRTEFKQTNLTGRIIGGVDVESRNYIVYLRKNKKVIGTGCYIGFKVALVAAHCVYDLEAPLYGGVRVVNSPVMATKATSSIPNSKGQSTPDCLSCNNL